jgi:hypothetical protein
MRLAGAIFDSVAVDVCGIVLEFELDDLDCAAKN